MQHRSQNINIRFGAQGGPEITRTLRGIAQSLNQVRGAGLSMLDGFKVGVGMEAFSKAWEGITQSLDITSDEYVQAVSRLSNIPGTTLEEMSRLAGVARRFGVDIDDLRGSMIQFYGQVAEAAKGESIAEDFEAIGISSQFLTDNLEDPIKILLAVAKAQREVSGASRATLLSKLFGEDDSVKVGIMLNELGRDADEVVTALEEIDASGAIVTQADVDVNREFVAAMAEFGDVFRGLKLELGRGILPTISKLTAATADWLRGNKEFLSGAILGGWERIGRVIETVVTYLRDGKNAVSGTWLYPIIGWAEQLGAAAGTAGRMMNELFDELSGQRTTREFAWIDGLADGLRMLGALSVTAISAAFAGAGVIATGALELLGHLPEAIKWTQDRWQEFADGFQGTGNGSFLAETGSLLGSVVTYMIDLGKALGDIAAGKPIDPQFDWLKSLIDQSPDFVRSIKDMGNLAKGLADIGGGFGTVVSIALPFAGAAAIYLSGIGGVLAVVVALAVAVANVIVKLTEMNSMLRAPFDAVDNWFNDISGVTQGREEEAALNRSIMENSLAYWEKMRPKGADGTVDVAVRPVADPSAPPVQADVQLTPMISQEEVQAVIDRAQMELNGSINIANLGAQVEGATVQGAGGINIGSGPAVAPMQGIPIVIQLQPSGQEVTLYAESEDAAQRLLDMHASARRASATPGGLPFAGGNR